MHHGLVTTAHRDRVGAHLELPPAITLPVRGAVEVERLDRERHVVGHPVGEAPGHAAVVPDDNPGHARKRESGHVITRRLGVKRLEIPLRGRIQPEVHVVRHKRPAVGRARRADDPGVRCPKREPRQQIDRLRPGREITRPGRCITRDVGSVAGHRLLRGTRVRGRRAGRYRHRVIQDRGAPLRIAWGQVRGLLGRQDGRGMEARELGSPSRQVQRHHLADRGRRARLPRLRIDPQQQELRGERAVPRVEARVHSLGVRLEDTQPLRPKSLHAPSGRSPEIKRSHQPVRTQRSLSEHLR